MKISSRLGVARLKKRLQPRSALALTLALDGIAVSVVRLRADGDGHDARPVRMVPVGAEDVLKNPAKAGAVLGAALDAAGMREKRCAVCVPPGWVLTASTDLPAVEPDDLRGYLELRAEREFPVALSELRLGHSPYTLPDGTRRATLAALPARRLEAVETMLAATGGRRAISISLALDDTLAADADPAPTLHFLAAPGHTEVVVTAGGGVAALRSLSGPTAEAAQFPSGSELLDPETPPAFDAVAFARDIRITLGRLPSAVSQGVRFARFGGDPVAAATLRRAIRDGLWRMGIESLEDEPSTGSPAHDAVNVTAEQAAVLRLRREAVPFEFVVVQPHRLEAVYTRYNTRFYRRVALALACVIFLPALGFFLRAQYEGRLNSQWDGMRDNVADLDGLQQKIRRLRPWFDAAPVTVSTLEKLFGLFPEGGDVWAKSIQVNSGGLITCTGFARNQKALLDLAGRLSDKKSGFSAVALKSQRGENPIQFTLTCQGGGPS